MSPEELKYATEQAQKGERESGSLLGVLFWLFVGLMAYQYFF